MQVRHKNLSVEICDPPLPLRSPEFKAEFAFGLVPILDLLDGNTIAESSAIMRYLEACFPEPSMIPIEPLLQAHNEMLIRFADNHMSNGLRPVFQEFMASASSADSSSDLAGDSVGAAQRFELMKVELDKLNRLLIELPEFTARDLQIGDLSIVSNFFFIEALASYFDQASPISDFFEVNRWHHWVKNFPAVSAELEVMTKSFDHFLHTLEQAA